MTEKRFTKGYHTIHDTIENKTYDFRVDIICNLLNKLDEHYVGEFSLRETLQLELQRVENENEQLKQTIKKVYELLEEEVDLFSDKATEHDINAYIELRELDNKDAYYIATATKKAIKMLKGD